MALPGAGQSAAAGYNEYCVFIQVLAMTIDLFEDALPPPWREEIAPGAVVMHGFVRDHGPELLAAVQGVVAQCRGGI